MTSTLLQQQRHASPATNTATTTTAAATPTMAWSNEKLRFSCVDNIGLKQLWKLIALDTNSNATSNHSKGSGSGSSSKNNKNNNNMQQINNNNNNNNNDKINFENCENLADYLTNRDILPPNRMSLLKFLAINALELSAPATPALLQQNQQQVQQQQQQQQQQNIKPPGWMQLSGHPESIVPTTSGIVRKRVSSFTDAEVQAYQLISTEPQTAAIVPHFYGTRQLNGSDNFIELQDLLAGFKDPCVMDIKMGCRTFLESEVTNTTLRADLYQKMIAVDAQAPTAEEHAAAAITKLRYMLFREAMSSSHTKGFRIEALRLRGRAPVKDLKTVRSGEQIAATIDQFMRDGGHNNKKMSPPLHKQLVQRLKQMRSVMEQSRFFARHEVIGSSIFIVYDEERVGAWLIDFAKSRPLPESAPCLNHRTEWTPGNREEGLLKGMDELIAAFEWQATTAAPRQPETRKCLQI